MSQQIEKNVAEGSAAMADKEIVSITIPTFLFLLYVLTYFFHFRKLPPTPLLMKMIVMMLTKEHPLHHPLPVMM